jgi:DNA-binding response OmpR family regulator
VQVAALRILIVEDEGMIADYIESMLQTAGYDVPGMASSANEVFAMVAELQPDLILMDIHIDGPLDGIQAAVKLREKYDVPIIYLSGYSDKQTAERARTTGGEILSKPVDQAKLLAAINQTLARHRAAV